MNTLYNTQEDFAIALSNTLRLIDPNIRKTQLNIIPYIIFGMINSESSVSFDIVKNLKGRFSSVQLDSSIKRIKRLYNNKFFDPYAFFDKAIRHILSSYKKKHSDKRVHIVFDHMFSHDNYVVFMITMRIGSQGIPLWFRAFKSKNSNEAFDEELLKEGISYVSNLFGDDYDLIFLADRWFNSTSLLQHISDLGHTYCVRLKGNIKSLIYDKKEGHDIRKTLGDIKPYHFHSSHYNDIEITNSRFKTNIAISSKQDTDTPWIIATNGDCNRAIKDYKYRFGGIESVFKNQKSNGFFIESTVNASIKYFSSMYSLVCFGVLFLTILGADYSKNTRCYKHVKIVTHKIIKKKRKRVMSLFNTGLTLFHLALNSEIYIRIPFSLILYAV